MPRPLRLPCLLALALAIAALPARTAPGQTEIGDPVVLAAPEVVLRIGARPVATGEVHRVFTIRRKQGDWLWLEAPDLAGWARADQVVPFDRRLREASARIDSGNATAEAYNARALLWFDRGRTDLALADYTEALRLDPEYSAAFMNRGLAYLAMGELDKALEDLDRAVEHAPADPLVHYNRALARTAAGRIAEALEDLDRTLELDPALASAWFNRAALHLVAGHPLQAAADAQVYLRRAGWNETLSPYAALIAWCGARRGQQDELARALLLEAKIKANKKAWPYPILLYLDGELDLDALLERATTEDHRAEARAYAAVAMQARGEPAFAAEQFRWLLSHADPSRLPGLLARAALEGPPSPPQAP